MLTAASKCCRCMRAATVAAVHRIDHRLINDAGYLHYNHLSSSGNHAPARPSALCIQRTPPTRLQPRPACRSYLPLFFPVKIVRYIINVIAHHGSNNCRPWQKVVSSTLLNHPVFTLPARRSQKRQVPSSPGPGFDGSASRLSCLSLRSLSSSSI